MNVFIALKRTHFFIFIWIPVKEPGSNPIWGEISLLVSKQCFIAYSFSALAHICLDTIYTGRWWFSITTPETRGTKARSIYIKISAYIKEEALTWNNNNSSWSMSGGPAYVQNQVYKPNLVQTVVLDIGFADLVTLLGIFKRCHLSIKANVISNHKTKQHFFLTENSMASKKKKKKKYCLSTKNTLMEKTGKDPKIKWYPFVCSSLTSWLSTIISVISRRCLVVRQGAQCLLFVVLPQWIIRHLAWYHTQTHYPDTGCTSPSSIPKVRVPSEEQLVLILMTLVCRVPGSNIRPPVFRSSTDWATGAKKWYQILCLKKHMSRTIKIAP